MDTDESKTPVTEAPAAEKPAAETPAADTPAAEKPAAEKPKKPLWKRVLKWSLWTIGGLLIFVILALLTLPLWVNPVVTSVANSLVPDYTGTAFKLARVELNPYTGKLLVSGVQLANPEGYSEKDAFTLGSLSAEVEVSSLLSSTIHVRDVTVDALFASWVFDAAGTNNFDRIIATVNEKLGPKKEKKKEPSETKVVIDKVTIKNVRVVVNTGVFELESLTLVDFGKADKPAQIELVGAKLVNPEGFPEPNAFSLKSLSIGLETADLAKKPMVFHDIVVDSTYAGLVYNDAGDSNFDVMFKPFKGFRIGGEYTLYDRNYSYYSFSGSNLVTGKTVHIVEPYRCQIGGTLDARVSYSFDFGSVRATLAANVTNVLNQHHIEKAWSASTVTQTIAENTKDNIYFFYNKGRQWNIRLKLNF